MTDQRQFAPATLRNRAAILEVLKGVLPPSGTVLEIAAGTGEHAVFFAEALPHLDWLPSDCNPIALRSIAAWRSQHPLQNLHPPIHLDVTEHPWALDASLVPPVAIANINMIHISPWRCCEALFQGGREVLASSGILFLYGPFKRGGAHTAPSNEMFDESLRAQNPDWGVRDLEAVQTCGEAAGFALRQVIPMPANNFSVIFQRQ